MGAMQDLEDVRRGRDCALQSCMVVCKLCRVSTAAQHRKYCYDNESDMLVDHDLPWADRIPPPKGPRTKPSVLVVAEIAIAP